MTQYIYYYTALLPDRSRIIQQQCMKSFQLQQDQQKLLPESKQHPRAYRWKTVALGILVLSFIFTILDICLKVYIDSHPNPALNLSFVNSILESTGVVATGPQAEWLLGNLARHQRGFYYQYADQLVATSGANFTAQYIKDSIFRKESSDLMFLFRVALWDRQQQHTFGMFIPTAFPIPEEKEYNSSLDYYTFEHGGSLKSMIFSLENSAVLVMNTTIETSTTAGWGESTDAKLKCKTYFLSEGNNQFGALSLFKASLDDSPRLEHFNLTESYPCFQNIGSEQQLDGKLQAILGFDIANESVLIEKYEVYYLWN